MKLFRIRQHIGPIFDTAKYELSDSFYHYLILFKPVMIKIVLELERKDSSHFFKYSTILFNV